jgi:hypothetical protein
VDRCRGERRLCRFRQVYNARRVHEIQLTSLQAATLSSSDYLDPPSLRETSQKRQKTNFRHRENLLHSEKGTNYNGPALRRQQSDNFIKDVLHPIEPPSPNNIAVPLNNEEQINIQQGFPYTNENASVSIDHSAINNNHPGGLIHNIGTSFQLDNLQNQAQEWQPSPVLGSNTPDTHIELDESLTLSKHLSNRMPDMYY